MSYVLKFEERVRGWRTTDQGTDPIGKYLVRFEPHAYDGQGAILVSRFVLSAKRFDSPREAVAFWSKPSTTYNYDGNPVRPLTAFLVSVHEVEDE